MVSEVCIRLFNLWTLIATIAILLYPALEHSTTALVLIALDAVLLPYKPYRTWVMTRRYLAIASIRNLWTKETVWRKQTKAGW